MADSPIVRAAALAVAVLWMLAAGIACAQDAQTPTPAPTPENTSPAAEAQRQATQPLNNAPVWRGVRSGAPQVTTVRGRETNVLIQPQGQTWRALRVPIYATGGFVFALTLLGIAAFYSWRGPIVTHSPPTGHLVMRFSFLERVVHW